MSILNSLKRTKKKAEDTKDKKTQGGVEEEKAIEVKADAVKTNETRHGLKHKSVLLRPGVSEKDHIISANNQYVFIVAQKATKNEVKKEVESRFNVHVLKVNVLNRKGKPKQWRGKQGIQKKIRKAIITVKTGEKIEAVVI